MHCALYSLRAFYAEEGKSLIMEYSHYFNGACRYRAKKICINVLYGLHRKMHRINGWHKLDVFHKRIGKGYCASKIWDSEVHLHPQIAYKFSQRMK